MTQTTAPTLTDVHDMVVVHRAFRREFGLLPRLVRGVAAGDTRRAAVVFAAHARMCLTALHHHHSGEDDLLWPKLLERAVPDTALVERMEAQHERVHHALETLGPALERWETEARPAVSEEVAAGVEALCGALFEHLAEESVADADRLDRERRLYRPADDRRLPHLAAAARSLARPLTARRDEIIPGRAAGPGRRRRAASSGPPRSGALARLVE